MMEGGGNCETVKMDLRYWLRRGRETPRRYYHQIKYRLLYLSGFYANRGSVGPFKDEPKRPRGIWFWTKQYFRNILGTYKHRMMYLSGYYEWVGRQMAAEVRGNKVSTNALIHMRKNTMNQVYGAMKVKFP